MSQIRNEIAGRERQMNTEHTRESRPPTRQTCVGPAQRMFVTLHSLRTAGEHNNEIWLFQSSRLNFSHTIKHVLLVVYKWFTVRVSILTASE